MLVKDASDGGVPTFPAPSPERKVEGCWLGGAEGAREQPFGNGVARERFT